MKAILLAAGYGSRLRPLTGILPKCLLPINGRPLLEYWFFMLSKANVKPILLNLHYLADIMKRWVGFTEYAQSLKLVYEEELLGTGGTLLINRDFVGNGPVMLIHADNLCLIDISSYINAHTNRPPGVEITMMTFNTPTPETCGIVEIDNLGIVRAFYEKIHNPPGTLANAAVYIVEPTVIEFLSSLKKTFIDFSTEVLPHYVKTGKVFTYHNDYYHRDIGNIDSYLAAQIEFPQSTNKNEPKDAWKMFFENSSNDIDKKIMSALSSALNRELADSSIFLDKIKNGLLDKKKKYIICCSYDEKNIKSIKKMVEDEGLSKADIIIFLPKVPYNFSSRLLYEKTGFKSIALCSSDN